MLAEFHITDNKQGASCFDLLALKRRLSENNKRIKSNLVLSNDFSKRRTAGIYFCGPVVLKHHQKLIPMGVLAYLITKVIVLLFRRADFKHSVVCFDLLKAVKSRFSQKIITNGLENWTH